MAQVHETGLLEGIHGVNGEEDGIIENEYKIDNDIHLPRYLASRGLFHIFKLLRQMQLFHIQDIIVFTEQELNELCGYLNLNGIDKLLFKGAIRTLQLENNTFHSLYQSPSQQISPPSNIKPKYRCPPITVQTPVCWQKYTHLTLVILYIPPTTYPLHNI